MCQINENPTETIECKCKQICCKMQNDSLRYAIDVLTNNQHNTKAILGTLDAICNLLEVYSCLPGICLLKRVKWVHENIAGGDGGLYSPGKIKV